VSAAAIRAGAPAAASGAVTNPWLIAIVVALASFMEVLDTTIANVALPYIAGGMGVSEDEASWVVTTYLVSNAIVLTASSFLARMLGRKTFFLICLGLFTLSSILCGIAPNLNALLLFRVLEGFGGGGMVPVAQSILADSFPPTKRGLKCNLARSQSSMRICPLRNHAVQNRTALPMFCCRQPNLRLIAQDHIKQ
jgi:MFS transporter, DHA2 family, multidrug resistance protein